MEPQFSFLTGEKTLSPNTRLKQSSKLTAEKMGLMRNIMAVVPTKPSRLVSQEKGLKVGLKFGAEARYNPKQAMLTEA